MKQETRKYVYFVGQSIARLLFARRASQRFSRAVAEAGAAARIAIGSGGIDLSGWICTEYDIAQNRQYFLDITRAWPIPKESIAYIYGDNVIEHITLPGARAFFHNAFTAMCPGAIIRLATPDAEAAARAYLDDPDLVARHLDRHRRHHYDVEYPVDILRVTYAYHGHPDGYIHDFESLSTELIRAGFVDVKRVQVGASEHDALRGLETRAEPTDSMLELVVEARRPAD